LDDRLTAELQPGERVVWSGQPDTSRWFPPDEPGRVAMNRAVGAFAIALSALILGTNLSDGISVFDAFPIVAGLVFAVLGLYLLPGRVIARRYFGRRTTYALTNLRALVIRPARSVGRRMSSVLLASSPTVSERIYDDGYGTVWIGATIYQRAAWFAGDPGWLNVKPYERQDVTFWNIPEAAEVSRLARQLISEVPPTA
jgi:hypothetical protein